MMDHFYLSTHGSIVYLVERRTDWYGEIVKRLA
jgi:hypothetical protein